LGVVWKQSAGGLDSIEIVPFDEHPHL